jgi:hypothetical protein
MKKTLLLSVLLMSFDASAQTIDETEDWIQSTIGTNYDENYEYEISQGEITQRIKPIAFSEVTRNISRLEAADVTKISHIQADGYLSFYLACDKPDCVYNEVTRDGKFLSDGHADVLGIHIKGEFPKSMIPRMQKALLHLVSLYGGSARAVPYVSRKKKEAF